MSDPIVVEYYPASTAHWYTMDGEPMHTVIAKTTGKPKPTTLREARTMDLVPSVTNIMGIKAKPQIVNWKVRNAIAAGLKAKTPEEAIEIFEHETSVASKRGTRYHKAIEVMLQTGQSVGPTSVEFDVPIATLEAVMKWVDSEYAQKFVCEQPFATNEYGGCIDLWSPELCTDFKTSEKPRSWPEHKVQLAAYENAKPAENACILLINTAIPGEIEPVHYDAAQLTKGMRTFNICKAMWQDEKNWEVKR